LLGVGVQSGTAHPAVDKVANAYARRGGMRYKRAMDRPLALILDFGSQYTMLIARRIRELGVYCEILPCTVGLERVRAIRPRCVILSGGPSSVFDEGAPSFDRALFELGVPVLGICYGEQLTAHLLGGKVEKAAEREYGPAKVTVHKNKGILARFYADESLDVWMSHGDRVIALPDGFEVLATSPHSPFAAVGDDVRRIYGVQFHPEVHHTPRGKDVLAAFLFDVAQMSSDWSAGVFVDEAIAKVRSQVGGGRAICGLSGGVDSSVAAVLCHRALGGRLTCVFVDNGLLRKGEREQVENVFREQFALDLRVIDASERFLRELHGVTDPEKKRKIIGKVFIDVFDEVAHSIEGVTHLVQGTLYPDVIESVSFKGPSAVIKSHHNVGGLPERMKLSLVEPLRELFKDEVRAVGEAMGLPREVLWRHPFPGPGLGIRCLGDLNKQRLDVLRAADAIVEDELRKNGLYDSVWQCFAALLPVRSVGVMGDERTYDECIAIRAVTSVDGMTADWARLPYDVLSIMSSRIINEVRGVNRVVYDISSKPPATIEWE
jgi:GMP synthase (glutamine-hydrolysing)